MFRNVPSHATHDHIYIYIKAYKDLEGGTLCLEMYPYMLHMITCVATHPDAIFFHAVGIELDDSCIQN